MNILLSVKCTTEKRTPAIKRIIRPAFGRDVRDGDWDDSESDHSDGGSESDDTESDDSDGGGSDSDHSDSDNDMMPASKIPMAECAEEILRRVARRREQWEIQNSTIYECCFRWIYSGSIQLIKID
ncbi:hypothetical protein KIN20_011342 [Parelaphostrongylus tenuis]|uniref:Uncharacterized protein n=1 Tax=Parelaphostrongylus tenuis TaxID=148309 RepID=A0AAD5MTI7_PARTN|nr:hypothetical protein KIN20_011342 [Parelaphostrongylus tenuis]